MEVYSLGIRVNVGDATGYKYFISQQAFGISFETTRGKRVICTVGPENSLLA